ncbi:MAG: RDD family protein [Kiloniellales bacterium]|nr:RDD family protein [Kiloniellales bacterium]
MTDRPNLPTTALQDAAWEGEPPRPPEDPDLFDGVLWRRVVGYGVDVLLLTIIFSILGLIVFLSFGLLAPINLAIAPFVPIAYHTFFIGRDAATPGMKFMDLEARTWTGGRPDYFQALLMTILFYASIAITWFLVLLVPLFNDRRRTLHDLLSGIVVVRRSRVEGGIFASP